MVGPGLPVQAIFIVETKTTGSFHIITSMTETDRKKFYTPSEVAELLMISPVTVRQLSQKGELESVTTPGGHRRYLFKQVESFARKRNIPLALKANTGLRVLIVDDDQQLAQYINELLQECPDIEETRIANDGFRAGAFLYTFEPHIVLLDLRMPYVDGFSVCRDIKSGQLTKDIRVIAMSGFYSNENIAHIIEAGAETCLKKPFAPEELFAAIGINAVETI